MFYLKSIDEQNTTEFICSTQINSVMIPSDGNGSVYTTLGHYSFDPDDMTSELSKNLKSFQKVTQLGYVIYINPSFIFSIREIDVSGDSFITIIYNNNGKKKAVITNFKWDIDSIKNLSMKISVRHIKEEENYFALKSERMVNDIVEPISEINNKKSSQGFSVYRGES